MCWMKNELDSVWMCLQMCSRCVCDRNVSPTHPYVVMVTEPWFMWLIMLSQNTVRREFNQHSLYCQAVCGWWSEQHHLIIEMGLSIQGPAHTLSVCCSVAHCMTGLSQGGHLHLWMEAGPLLQEWCHNNREEIPPITALQCCDWRDSPPLCGLLQGSAAVTVCVLMIISCPLFISAAGSAPVEKVGNLQSDCPGEQSQPSQRKTACYNVSMSAAAMETGFRLQRVLC